MRLHILPICFYTCLILGGAHTGSAQAAQMTAPATLPGKPMLLAQAASIYKDRKLVQSLPSGTMLWVLESRRGWATVLHLRQRYDIRDKDLRSLRDLRRAAELAKVQLENRLQEIDAAMARNIERQHAVQRGILQVQVDHTRRFAVPVETRRRLRVQPAQSGVTRLGRSEDKDGEQSMTSVQLYYIDKITTNNMKRKRRELTTQLEALQTSLAEQRQQRREVLTGLQTGVLTQQHQEQKFKRFEQNDVDYERNLYMVVSEDTKVYRKRAVVGRLAHGRMVLARPNPKFDDWLHVQADADAVVDGQRKNFISFPTWEKAHKTERIAGESTMRETEQDLLLLAHRYETYGEMSLQLDIELDTYGKYSVVHGGDSACTICGIDGVECRHNVIEVLDRTHARRILKDWEKIREDLREDMRGQRQAVGSLREKLVNMKHDFEEVLEKQDEFLAHYTRRADGR